jgi:hypothetical protein
MLGKTDGLPYEDFPYHQFEGREDTHLDRPVHLAASRYDGVLVVEVQHEFPTGGR